MFQPDRAAETAIDDATLRALALTAGQQLTYTCVPPGSAIRAGVDRDGDTVFDADESDQGTDPGSELSVPSSSVTCSSASTPEFAKLRVTRNESPAGDERITVAGEWTVSSANPAIDPIANGLRFRVSDASGQPLYNRVIPRGAPIIKGAPGWTLNRRGTKWTYRDTKGIRSPGITRATVQDKSGTVPGRYAVTVTGKLDAFRIDPSALPAQLLIVLGGLEQAAAGQCASIAFNNSASPPPHCTLSASGATVSCK